MIRSARETTPRGRIPTEPFLPWTCLTKPIQRDELAVLALDPVRCDYELSGDEPDATFARFVLIEIVLKGYATHGPIGSFAPEAVR